MNSSWVSILISVVAILSSAALAWIIAVVVMRQRVTEAEQKLTAIKTDIAALFIAVNTIQSENARCDQSRKTMDIAILRLDEVKASKEMVDLFRNDLHNLTISVDKRFDKIEELLNKVLVGKANN